MHIINIRNFLNRLNNFIDLIFVFNINSQAQKSRAAALGGDLGQGAGKASQHCILDITSNIIDCRMNKTKEMLAASNFLSEIPISSNSSIYYHTLLGKPHLLKRNSIRILNLWKKAACVREVKQAAKLIDFDEIFLTLRRASFIVPLENEREKLKKKATEHIKYIFQNMPFHILEICITEKCNFACSYCMCDKITKGIKNKTAAKNIYDLNKIKYVLSHFFKNLKKQNVAVAGIIFGGGEPFLFFQHVKDIYAYSKKLARETGTSIRCAIRTNGSLLKDEQALFLKRNNIVPFLSLDGTEKYNNRVRTYKNKKGTYKDIIKGIALLDKYQVRKEGGVQLTLTEANIDFNERKYLDLCRQWGYKKIVIEPDLFLMSGRNSQRFADKIISFYLLGKKNDIYVTGLWKRPFDNLIRTLNKNAGHSLAYCAAQSGASISVQPSGALTFCPYHHKRLGHSKEFDALWEKKNYRKMVEKSLAGNIKMCQGCELEGFCLGGCYWSRKQTLHSRCDLVKELTKRLLKIEQKSGIFKYVE